MKKKEPFKMICDKCGKIQVPDKSQSNENWEVYNNISCECGGKFKPMIPEENKPEEKKALEEIPDGKDKKNGRFLPGNQEGKKKAGKKHKNKLMVEKIEELKAANMITGLKDLKSQTLATAAYFLMHGTKNERKEAYKELLPYMEPKLKSTEIKTDGKERIIRVYLPPDAILNKDKKEGKEDEEIKKG